MGNDPKPTMEYTVDVVTKDSLGNKIVQIDGKKYDLGKAGEKVRVSGPRDKRVCAICIPYVGGEYKRDDPSIQMFRNGGAHPRCRHYLVPVGIPGLEDDRPKMGMDHVKALVDKGNTTELKRLYGKTRTEKLLSGEVGIEELYRKDGTLKLVKDLDPVKAAPNPYKTFQSAMEAKYGKDNMILAMTDKEMDKLQALEREHRTANTAETSMGVSNVEVKDDGLKALGHGRQEEDYCFHRGKDPKTTEYISLFADDRESILSYGEDVDEYAIPTKSLQPPPKFILDHAVKHYHISKDEADALINPVNIVESAGAWDDMEYVSLVWEDHENYWLQQMDKGVLGIKTHDGAIVWPGPHLKDQGLLRVAEQ